MFPVYYLSINNLNPWPFFRISAVCIYKECTYLCAAKRGYHGRGNKSSLFYFIGLEAYFIEEKIHRLLATKFQEEHFTDCYLVGFELHKHNKLEVFVDSDSGLTLDKCQRISRYLESFIDEEGWFDGKYTLEVSSPGLSRPLKLKRQYKKNIGRELEVSLNDGTKKTGVLKAVGEELITLEETVVLKEGKKKKKSVVQTELPFDRIKKTFVAISFK